ncbi:MAG: DNA/RNA nuclease SfsA [Phyllobacteriaceae bacterium]|nr:DNA/RNA nuclease SfsA [Phyllobacteriaceae bacterium]
MQFPSPLIPATLIQRYKRFLADVRLHTGEVITTTCPNTGTMLGMTDPGLAVYLSRSDSPTRKYAHTWHITDKPGIGLVGIDTSLPNRITEEAITAQAIPPLSGYPNLRREVKYGENSRIDLLLQGGGKPDCYVEVKNVTLVRQPGLAEFPDCRTDRGAKHLREMSEMVRQGHRAVMVYLIQCASPTRFTLTRNLDPTYVEAYIAARNAGVEAIALTCHVSLDSIRPKAQVPVIDPS